MPDFELAELNIAIMRAPLDAPEMRDFVANLDRINALAEHSPGFIWRLQTEDGDATAIRHFGDDVLINMSVWESVQALHDYAFKSAHRDLLRRRKEWFDSLQEAYLVLWWVAQGHRPTLDEAGAKLALLRAEGATPQAFSFRETFPPPGEPGA